MASIKSNQLSYKQRAKMALSIISYRINIGILSIYTALGCILGVQMSAFEFEGPF